MVWTPKDAEALSIADNEMARLKQRKAESDHMVLKRLEQLIDKGVKYHHLNLRDMAIWIAERRWVLVDILTEGEFQRLMNEPETYHVKIGSDPQ